MLFNALTPPRPRIPFPGADTPERRAAVYAAAMAIEQNDPAPAFTTPAVNAPAYFAGMNGTPSSTTK